MITSKALSIAAALFAGVMTATSASASIFTYDYHQTGIWAGYNEETSTYGMKFKDGDAKDGFWLVVANDDKIGSDSEYAVLYGDRDANRVTAYTYDKEKGADSYTSGEFLGSYENVFASAGLRDGVPMTMLTLDGTVLNAALDNPEWQGIAISASLDGLQFNQTGTSSFSYGADGSILDYSFVELMQIADGEDRHPNNFANCGERFAGNYCVASTAFTSASSGSVPAPGGLALILVGLAGLRRFSKAV